MRVNNFAIFCELDRALTPVAPRVGLARPLPDARLVPHLPLPPAGAMEELKRLSAHGAGFIGSIDTCLVQSHTVVEHPSDGGYWL